jgi:AraC-like DNA-binding protein
MAHTHRSTRRPCLAQLPGFSHDRIVDLYATGLSEKSIARVIGCSRQSIARVLRSRGVFIRRNRTLSERLDAEQQQSIVDRYEAGSPAGAIAADYGVGQMTVFTLLRQCQVRIRGRHEHDSLRYPVDDSAFDEPSEERNYWIGFLMADGCVHHRRQGGRPVVTLTLAAKDIDHVERFRRFLKTEAPVYRGLASIKATQKKYPTARVQVTSSRLADSLATFGVVPHKYNREEVFQLGNCRHFWRGMVDGDGCLAIRSGQTRIKPILHLLGSRTILTQFIEFIRPSAPHWRERIIDRGGIHIVQLSTTSACQVARLLYEDATVYLPRKYELAQQLMLWKSKTTPRLRDTTMDQLNALHAEHGSWAAVARHLGMRQPHLCRLRRQLRERTASSA